MQAFLSDAELAEKVKFVLAGKRPRCAVAFIGKGFESKLTSKTKIVCNLSMGGTNPYAIEALLKLGLDIKQSEKLHAKVYISDRGAVVCSANLSSNGLGSIINSDCGWIEAGIYTDDVADIQTWYNRIPCEEIKDSQLERAKRLWNNRNHVISDGLNAADIDFLQDIGLYWWAYSPPENYKIDYDKIAQRVGDTYDRKVVDHKSFWIGRRELDTDIKSRYFLIYKLSGKSGAEYGRASALSWVFAAQRIPNGVVDLGKYYPMWVDNFPPRPDPVFLSSEDKGVLLDLLNSEKYSVLRSFTWNPWFTKERKASMIEFWLDAKRAVS